MDIKVDNTGDLDFTDGDLHLTDGTSQHATDLIVQGKGENKGAFAFGVGIRDYLLDENDNGNYLRETRMQLQKLGMKVNDIGIDGQLFIDANYVDSKNR